MQTTVKTFKTQSSFASAIRQEKAFKSTLSRPEALEQYRKMVFHVAEEAVSSAYPLTRNLLSQTEWSGLVKDFYRSGTMQSPQIWRMPEALIDFVRNDYAQLQAKYPFLLELMRFEWAEVAVYMMPDQIVEVPLNGQSENGNLVLNPETELLHFHFPVHLKPAGIISVNDRSNFFLSLHRHPESGKVLFTNLSPLTAQMIALLNEGIGMDIPTLIKLSCESLQFKYKPNYLPQAVEFVNQCIQSRLILGFTNP
ncbi:MAG: putative DNA-binding domain-containing protein [Bacteroidales bacterium]|jgi:hypothetical protein|nr:putative DNA-binding domain-containing protein [Bacteroidales bacterium]MDN5350283.1 uncharacterized protein [Bacteroidales bacterium]